MNWSQMEGQWDQLRGTVKERWGKLTDDDVKQIEGKGDKLVGLVQQKYGIAKEKAESEVNEWLDKAKGMFESAKDTVNEAVKQGKEYLQQSNFSDVMGDVKDLIARHPLPAAIIGLGIGYCIGRMLTPSNRS